MIQLEIRVISDHREGLLIELGRVVHSNNYTVLRQRMVAADDGKTCLTMLVRGPAERQMVLEEALATHARVSSFEAALQEGVSPNAANLRESTSADAPASNTHASGANQSAPASTSAVADTRAVEAVLPQIASDYPKIFPWLLELQRSVVPEASHASLHQASRRTGAWVFKRDFAFGAKLNLHDAIRRIALPAMRAMTTAEMQGEHLRLLNHSLAQPGGRSGCRFFCGFLEGLLGESVSSQTVFVRETFCRCAGADACTFEMSH